MTVHVPSSAGTRIFSRKERNNSKGPACFACQFLAQWKENCWSATSDSLRSTALNNSCQRMTTGTGRWWHRCGEHLDCRCFPNHMGITDRCYKQSWSLMPSLLLKKLSENTKRRVSTIVVGRIFVLKFLPAMLNKSGNLWTNFVKSTEKSNTFKSLHRDVSVSVI